MNYIYDISLNFNKELYNFYEWNDDDDVEFYLKIPFFKVENEVINDFIKSSFIVEKQLLNRILNKTELYGKTKIVNKKYSCIFSSNSVALAVSFDEKGNSISKSFLSIDDEEEVLDFSRSIKYSIINYKIKEKKNNKDYLTRSEKLLKKELLNIIKNIYNNKEFSKLKYLFYEVYDEKNEDEKIIYTKLINLVENNSGKINKITSIFKELKTDKKLV